MPAPYALNNFNKAVRILSKAGLGKREWLASRYVEQLCQLELTDIPDALRVQFIKFRLGLKFARAECKTGALKTSINTMDDAEVDEMFSLVIAMHEAITQLAH